MYIKSHIFPILTLGQKTKRTEINWTILIPLALNGLWDNPLEVVDHRITGVMCLMKKDCKDRITWFSRILTWNKILNRIQQNLNEHCNVLMSIGHRGWAEPEPKLCARIKILVFVWRLPEIPAFRLQMSGRKQEEYILPVFIQKV